MPTGIYESQSGLMLESVNISVNTTKVSTGVMKIDWNIPKNINAYNGAVVVLSDRILNPSNAPTDGVTYTASDNLNLPSNKIGNAFVVGAFYNDITTKSVTVTGVCDTCDYYAAVFICDNVKNYYDFGALSYNMELNTAAYAANIQDSFGPPENPYIGEVYYDNNSKFVQMWTGAAWIPAGQGTTKSGDTLPVGPGAQGEFFYHNKEKQLYCYSTNWLPVATDKIRKPTYAKTGIGTDGTYDERATLKNILKGQLGWPTVCVELEENHFNIAIDNAIQELRHRSDAAYHRQYFFMKMYPGQQTYYLNNPENESDKIVSVIAVRRVRGSGLYGMGGDAVWAQAFMNQIYSMGQLDLVTVYETSALMEMHTQLFAGDISFNWREAARELKIYRKIYTEETVLIETAIEKTEQELITDRWATQWIQNWSLAELRIILGMIRGKFQNMPGVGGNLSLNADSLINMGQQEQQDLQRQILDNELGDLGEFGYCGGLMG